MNFRMTELSGAVALVQLGRLDGLMETMRTRKVGLKEGISQALARAGGEFRTLADPAGDTAIALIFFMPTVELAQRAIAALKAEQIGASALYDPDKVDYHVYAHWAPILAQRTWTTQGGPWRWGEPVTYTATCVRAPSSCSAAPCTSTSIRSSRTTISRRPSPVSIRC